MLPGTRVSKSRQESERIREIMESPRLQAGMNHVTTRKPEKQNRKTYRQGDCDSREFPRGCRKEHGRRGGGNLHGDDARLGTALFWGLALAPLLCDADPLRRPHLGRRAHDFVDTNEKCEITHWEIHVRPEHSDFLDAAIGVHGLLYNKRKKRKQKKIQGGSSGRPPLSFSRWTHGCTLQRIHEFDPVPGRMRNSRRKNFTNL